MFLEIAMKYTSTVGAEVGETDLCEWMPPVHHYNIGTTKIIAVKKDRYEHG